MLKRAITVTMSLSGLLLSIFFVFNTTVRVHAQGATAQNHSQSDEQVSGPYDVVKNWPKPLATLWPSETGWTWGATQAIFAQNPNRIFISMRGELPIIKPGDFLSIYDEAQNVEVPGIGADGRSIWLTIPPCPAFPRETLRSAPCPAPASHTSNSARRRAGTIAGST